MNLNRCPECNGKLVRKKIDYLLLGENLGKYNALVCKNCNEQLFDEETLQKIEVIAKEKGLWGLETKTSLSQLGNSLAIRLNKKLVKFLKAHKGDDILVSPENKNRLIVELSK